ncbi:hypothetical protein Y032_0025g1097 [Ancylostoma ceylanicum]|uniref:Paired domain-containing protein n=1 Tax=Ancylostoma ceylanicum TaxID=53326 RepID=A0A016UUY2_9BILA|nr:hypothetical protein Y032_0025g1097 [Ancylostoma ceylanicum]
MASLEDNTAVVAMQKRGSSVSEISKALKLHREQVHRVISRSVESGGIESRPGGRLDRTARTPVLGNAIKSELRRNPERSIRQLAKNHKISRSTMRGLIRVDLELYPTNSPENNALETK